MKTLRFIFSLVFVVCAPTYGVAQCDLEELQKILDPTGDCGDNFGIDVSIDGDVAIVASRTDENLGSAFIYRFDGTSWVEEQKLTPRMNELSVRSVAIEDDVAVVGRVTTYIFRFNGVSWEEEAALLGGVGAKSLSLDHGVLIVGHGGGTGGGASIFSYNGTGWVLEDMITASNQSFGDAFGTAVSIDGKNRVAIVGAPLNDANCFPGQNCNYGSSYVFRYDGASWVEEQRLTASNASRDNFFGTAVSILGDSAAVGARDGAYVYRFNGSRWRDQQILTAEDNTDIGQSVALGERDVLAVGGQFHNGSIHLFGLEESRWIETQVFSPGDVTDANGFGFSIDISNDVLLVGSPNTNEASPGNNFCASGSAYFYRRNFDCSQGTVNTGSGPATDVLFVNGSPGNNQATVYVSLGEAVTFALDAAPQGPTPGDYILYAWNGFPVQCGDLMAMGELIGCLVNPMPLMRNQTPQPFRCLRSSSISGIACRGVVEKAGPETVPWALSLNLGFQQPAVFTLQGIIQDLGAGNPTGYSVTNAATVVAE